MAYKYIQTERPPSFPVGPKKLNNSYLYQSSLKIEVYDKNAILCSAVSRAILKQYTPLGSQTPTPKRSKVLISGVSFRKRSLSQSQKSDVLSYSEPKIAKNFQGFATGPHWGGLRALPQTPRLHNGFSPHYTRWKTGTPKKLLDTALLCIYWVTNSDNLCLFVVQLVQWIPEMLVCWEIFILPWLISHKKGFLNIPQQWIPLNDLLLTSFLLHHNLV